MAKLIAYVKSAFDLSFLKPLKPHTPYKIKRRETKVYSREELRNQVLNSLMKNPDSLRNRSRKLIS